MAALPETKGADPKIVAPNAITIVERSGKRFIRSRCRCGEAIDIDAGLAGKALTTEMDKILISMAASICCDRCSAKLDGDLHLAQRREEAGKMKQRKEVLLGFGKHFLRCSMPSLEMVNRAAWSQARDWLQGPSSSIVVHGEADSGKTWLARTLVFESFMAGRRVMEVTGWDLFDGSLLYRDETVVARTQRLRTCALLYIQGIDRGEPKLKHLGLLLDIMEERYERGMKTIMESQLEPAQVCAKWASLTGDPGIGGDIFSRLHPVVKLGMVQPKTKDGETIGMRQLAAQLKEVI